MSRSRPYQPLLLRLWHNLNAILVLAALITGFGVYNSYDGRFGRLPVPRIPEIIDLHGTIAVTFFLLFPAFALYSFHAGKQRLIQADSFRHLRQLNRPVGLISLHRVINTLLLLAVTLAAVSGRMMQEDWLPAGELHHTWYSLHLIAWLGLFLCLLSHLLTLVKVGGKPLFQAMLEVRFLPEDSPVHWPTRFRNWLSSFRP